MVQHALRPARWIEPRCAAPAAIAFLTAVGCGEEERPPLLAPYEPSENTMCEVGEPPVEYFFADFLDTAEYWRCPAPTAGSGGMSFTEVTGPRAAVTGGIARFDLTWAGEGELTGREIVFWVGSLTRGFYTFPAPSDESPQHWELRVNPEMLGGEYDLHMAISDGRDERLRPLIGVPLSTSLRVVQVGSGDIQINLNWDTETDLDLWVTEPGGTVIYYGAPRAASGGELDLDSYASCTIEGDEGQGNENVYWPVGAAPSGEYRVEVDLFSSCDTIATNQSTNYHVTVVANDRVSSYEGTFTPTDPEPRRNVTTFTY
jgi:hypothetical protein